MGCNSPLNPGEDGAMDKEIDILETRIYTLEEELRCARETINELMEERQSWHIGHGGNLC